MNRESHSLGKGLPHNAGSRKLVDAKTVEDFYAKDRTNINFWLAKMEKYSKENVVSSCLRSGVDRKIADEIAAEVDSYVDNRMRMSEVRPLIFAMLQRKNPAAAKKFKAGEIYVRTSGQRFERFNREKIMSSLLKETKILQPDADHIALEVEKFIRASNLDYVSSPLLREMVNAKLIEHGFEEARSDYTRIGMPVFDITELINIGSNENANLQYNPETLHKLIADNVFKEYALMKAIPKHATDAHLHGLVHIHDLDYFVLRPFCFSHDLRYFFKKGYYADGQGIHTAAAGPPKHAEVAILHAAKILASAQTQCFHKDEPVMIEEDGKIKIEKISEVVEKLKSGKEVNSFGISDYKLTKQPITRFNEHETDEEMVDISLENGKSIKLLAPHPLFVFDETRFKEVLAKDLKIGDYIPVPVKLPSSKNNMEELDLIGEVGQQKNLHIHEDTFNFARHGNGVSGSAKKQSFLCGSKFSLPKKIKITEKFMRLLGYFVSEGNIVWNDKTNVYDVQLSFGSHENELIEDAKDCIKSAFGLEPAISNPYSWVTQITFGGKLTAILFEKLCGRYAKNKKVPWIIFNVNDTMKTEFLKAYFDGDGHSHGNEIIFDTVSKRLASDLSYLLLQLGLISRIRKEKCKEREIGGRTLKETLRYRIEVQIKNLESVERYLEGFAKYPLALQIPTNHAGLRELYSEIKPSFDVNLCAALQKERTSREKAKQMLVVLKERCKTEEQKRRIEELEKIVSGDIGFLKIKEIKKEKSEGKFYDLTTPSQTFVGCFGGVLVHNCGGGQGYNWFNIFLAPFVRGFDYKRMKQMAQMFLFEMSQMYVARGGQTVFSSINLEPSVPKTLENIPAVLPGGITNGDTYGSYENEANQLFRAFIDVYTKGDAIGKPFNFPKCEVKVTAKDFDNHREEMDMVSALAAKFGTPYYFIQQDYMPEYACFQSLPFDEKVFVVNGSDELKIVKIGEYVEEIMKKQDVEKGKGLEGEVEVSEGAGFALSFNPETLEVEKRKIGKVMRHRTKEKIFKITLDTNRKISATAKHKIHVLRDGKIMEVRAEELMKGDYLVGLKNLELNFAFNDELDFKNRKMKIDKEFARLLGYFASEGYLHLANKKNRANKICFSFHEKEKEFIEDVEKILKEKFGLNPKRDVSVKNRCVTVYACDKSFAELFANILKTGFDAHSKRVPEKILSSPREIIKEFMLGLFRGDGYFKNTDKIKIDLHLCNKELIEDVFALSLRIGIPMDLFEGRESFSLRLTSNKRINSFLAEIPFAQCTKTDGGLIREFDFYERIPSQPFNVTREDMKTGHWNRAQIGKRITVDRLELSDSLPSRFADSDLHLFEVKEIEEIKSEYVYDFVDVDKHHNFANANGIFSSNCCAYLMPLSEQNTQDDLYNGTTRGGALQVVTINLPRIAYDAEGNDTKLFEILRERMKIARDVLLVKQKIIKQRMQQGVLPFLSQTVDDKGTTYLDVDKQSLEIGMVGLNEMLKVHTGHELHEGDDAWKFGMKVIKAMTDIAKEFSAETGAKFVTSRTPAESCSYRLASIDLKEMNGKAVVQGDRAKKSVYYTNGNHVRPSADVPLFDRLRIEASFNPLLVGGTMSHVWMGEANPDPSALTSLTERIVKKTLMAYYAYTKDLTVCKECKFVAPDLLKTCPHCNSKDIDWYSRITGYYQKVSGWNAGKLQELHDRRRYGVSS